MTSLCFRKVGFEDYAYGMVDDATFGMWVQALEDYLSANRPGVTVAMFDQVAMRNACNAGVSPVVFGKSTPTLTVDDKLDLIQKRLATSDTDGPLIFRMWAFLWLCSVHTGLSSVLSATQYFRPGAWLATAMAFVFLICALVAAIKLSRTDNRWNKAHGFVVITVIWTTFLVGLVAGLSLAAADHSPPAKDEFRMGSTG